MLYTIMMRLCTCPSLANEMASLYRSRMLSKKHYKGYHQIWKLGQFACGSVQLVNKVHLIVEMNEELYE